jgi:hypothetical protein
LFVEVQKPSRESIEHTVQIFREEMKLGLNTENDVRVDYRGVSTIFPVKISEVIFEYVLGL